MTNKLSGDSTVKKSAVRKTQTSNEIEDVPAGKKNTARKRRFIRDFVWYFWTFINCLENGGSKGGSTGRGAAVKKQAESPKGFYVLLC